MRLNGSPDIPPLSTYKPTHQIAQDALKAAFVYFRDEIIIVTSIVFDASSEREKEAHSVYPETIEGEEWIDNVASRFGHFLSAQGPVSVSEYLIGKGNIKGHQKGWPVDAVKPC